LVLPIYLLAALMPPAAVSAISLAPDRDDAGHPRNLVGERDILALIAFLGACF
jgi:hypothetical protein